MIRLLIVASLIVTGCAHAQSAPSVSPAPSAPSASPAGRSAAPALVVVVTVDQLTPALLDRWRDQLTGGLRRLTTEGAVFTQAYHDHAITETAPGHASILSGRFPYSTGIAANLAGVNTNENPLLGAEGMGASPARFVGTTLADWMTTADAETRVLSVSRKDRGAILPIGRGKYAVFWYAPSNGTFTNSTWYGTQLPDWVTRFNDEQPVMSRFAGRRWDLLLADSAYAEPDSVIFESFGQSFVFPYDMPSDTLTATNMLISFPFMDELTLDFAWRGVQEMQLGQRGHTDLLAVSLSTTDAVGHRWGPESREMHDQILRLDRSLGQFIDSLTERLGANNVIIALTSDHGGAPSPDMRSLQVDNTGARRVMLDDFQPAISASAARATQVRFPLEALNFDGFTLTVDRTMIRGRDRDIRNIAESFAKSARTVPGVLRVDLIDDLAKSDTVQDAIARRWLHMFRPGGDVAAVVTLHPYSVFGRGNVATHGSPHDYDAHVPLIFWGAPFRTVRDDHFVRVVDLAPTLAFVLGVRIAEKIDGRAIPEALRGTP